MRETPFIGSTQEGGRSVEAEPNEGLMFRRLFTANDRPPLDSVQWENRTALIQNEKGNVIFQQENVEVPTSWSQTATNIVASKYFHGKLNTQERERSVRQLIGRVVHTIVEWGVGGGYFASSDSRDAFRDELSYLLVEQRLAFNSPVWFNVGVQRKPQCSACFINSLQDTLESIMELAKTEGMLFKWGSGTGTNFSTLRASRESLSGGGLASGPVSFMKGFDAFAGVIKSGGKTRRAAKMVILNVDHPDIPEFIDCKVKEERKARVLIEQGYDSSIDGEAYSSVFFQNANHSVRVTDEFMEAAEGDREWWTRTVTDGKPAEQFRARTLLRRVAESAWNCGDPGMQFDSTINRWHTCKATDRIHASNPCSEYMFLDDTACNLASLNLLKFLDSDGRFDVEGFRHAVDITITAQDILVDNASYPTERIGRNSHEYRPLGLGYANLGALLMLLGVPYDSDRGRDICGAITALMTGEAYCQSASMAQRFGPFRGYVANAGAMLDVIRMHRNALVRITQEHVQSSLLAAAQRAWDDALAQGEKYGYKNSQVSVLAPTGTIGFMMDCDTTGIEPDLALVKQKRLVGGGTIRIVNNTVPLALVRLGYSASEVSKIVDFINSNGTIDGAPGLKAEHVAVFDCSLASDRASRSISWRGHVRMMAAAQPFLSGAISKTINMPEDSTGEDIMQVYSESWKLGLKAVAIYRNNSKCSQPLSAATRPNETGSGFARRDAACATVETTRPDQEELFTRAKRQRLSNERASITHKFSVGGHEGYLIVGKHEDGSPGEIFIKMAKEGSTLSGIMDAFALSVSMALQYGVPLRALIDKFIGSRFEPSGYTGNPTIRYGKSIVDYIGRWIGGKFVSSQYLDQGAVGSIPEPDSSAFRGPAADHAPSCPTCGMLMQPSGSCWRCVNCGSTSGCS